MIPAVRDLISQHDFDFGGLHLTVESVDDGYVVHPSHDFMCLPITGKTVDQARRNAVVNIIAAVIDDRLPRVREEENRWYRANPMCPIVAKSMGLEWDYETGDVKGAKRPEVIFPDAEES